MKVKKTATRPQTGFRKGVIAMAGAALFGATGVAHAFQLDFGPDSDWKSNFDNTVSYTYGMRAGGVNPQLGTNPAFAETENRFPNKGDTVTNRLGLLSEFDAVYQRRMGVRLSAALWKDAAYDDYTKTPAAASNYTDGKYSAYTKRWQIEGGELREAFVFSNFDLGERPANVKIGRLTEYWGNSLFFSAAGVAYSQNASDAIKALSVPGTQAKELSLPRGQISFSSQVADKVQVGAQYFFEAAQDRYPSGGTYFGLADFLFEGPDRAQAFGPFNTALSPSKPKDVNDNFGLQVKWSPDALDGTVGLYYRQFDETAPAGPLLGMTYITLPGPPVTPPSGFYPTSYMFVYPDKVKMLGFSLDKQIFGASVGLEVTYRENTALNTSPMAVAGAGVGVGLPPGTPGQPDPNAIVRGDTLNMVVNAVSVLDRSPLYSTGNLVAELGMIKKMRITKNEAFYNGEGTAACAGTGVPGAQDGRNTGCSSDTAFMVAGLFEPQWLQVAPGVDLSTPLFAMYGLSGNAASSGITVKEGDLMYSLGIKAVVNSRYNFTLQYNGYDGRSVASGATLTGNNLYQFKDRDWWSFAFSTTF